MGERPGYERVRAIKAFPDWFIENKPRLPKNERRFIPGTTTGKIPLQTAGQVGPVRLIEQKIKMNK
jgi:hypothetical protein